MSGSVLQSSRGLLAAVFLAMGCGFVSLAGFEFILVALQTDLGFSVDSANALIFMPGAASLLVVFVAGSLTDRWGPRRVLTIASTIFMAGTALVCLAPSLPFVVAGRILDGVGGVTLGIVALSVLNSTASDERRRARLFGFYAAFTPALFIISPGVSAFIVEFIGWRAAVIPWMLIGAATLVVTLRYVPRKDPAKIKELGTPLLAGLVLAGFALGILNASTSLTVAVGALVCGLAGLLLLVAFMRRIPVPTLDLTWCRDRATMLLLIAGAVAAMPSMFFYTKLLIQYRYVESLLVIAVLMALVQCSAIAGGLLSAPVSARTGPARAALAALVVSGIASLGTLVVTAQAPIWVPVVALAACVAPISFAAGPLANLLLSTAPAEASGAASSVRKATWTLGGVVGGALIGTLSFQAFQTRMSDLLQARGVPVDQALVLASQIRDGAVVDELVGHLPDPNVRDALIFKGPALLEAQSYAFWVMGITTAVLYFTAAVMMGFYMRRVAADRSQADSPWP